MATPRQLALETPVSGNHRVFLFYHKLAMELQRWRKPRLTICVVVQIRFETDSPSLKPIEDKMYVGSGRFIVEENEPIIVEYKISEVGAQCEGEQELE